VLNFTYKIHRKNWGYFFSAIMLILIGKKESEESSRR